MGCGMSSGGTKGGVVTKFRIDWGCSLRMSEGELAKKVHLRRQLAPSICLTALEFAFLFEFVTTFDSWDGNV